MAESNVFRPAFFRSRPFVFLFFGITIFMPLIWLIKTRSESLVIENGRVRYRYGLISKDETDAKIENIRSVRIKQTIGQRIFGAGDIEIFTAGDHPEITALGFVNPNAIKKLLDN